MRIAVSRAFPGDRPLAQLQTAGDVWVSAHDRALSAAELQRAVAGVDALVVTPLDRVDELVLDAAGLHLRVVANVAVGYDNIDVAACTRRDVIVTNTPGVLTMATAELAIGLMLALMRRLAEGDRLVRAGTAWEWTPTFMLGAGLQGRMLGVVGLGRIGAATARLARAFGMRIAYAGRRRSPAAGELEAVQMPLEELLAHADVVTLHCPLTPETQHLIDAQALASMQPHAVLVNTARGPVVDEDALVEALRSGAIAGAGLDVFEHEPTVHPGLLELENVVLVPHLGSATRETREAMAMLAVENVMAVLAGREPPSPVR